MQTIRARLDRMGQTVRALAFADGTRLLVLPDSGRVLGLYPPGSENNFLWTNPALTTDAANEVFDHTDWINPGGDRTWLAPEIELFIGDLARPLETYAVPSALDPGNWTLASATDTDIRLTNATRLRLLRAGREVGVRLVKRVYSAVNPLGDAVIARTGLQYAGYTQVTTVELEPVADAAIRLGLWNLMQLPSPGVMFVATRTASQPQVMFGTLSTGELAVEPRMVRWAMAARGADVKIGIKVGPLTGMAGYLRRDATAGMADLVVREFAIDPAGDYVDALWKHPHETGWVFQACCVRGGKERFNELEYHAPAVAAVTGSNRRQDVSHVWAFRGSVKAVEDVAVSLLGQSAETIITKE